MNKIGRKGKLWASERMKRIRELKGDKNYQIVGSIVFGICKDCKHFHKLNPDHKLKQSQGGGHEKENLDWICNEIPCLCHDKRDNQGDPMNKKETNKGTKKANWQKLHACVNCKHPSSLLICPKCKKISV